MPDSQQMVAKLGTALSPEEQKSVDQSKVGKLQAAPEKAEVEGQSYLALQVCPYCHCAGYGVESEFDYRLYTCHCCGGTFRA